MIPALIGDKILLPKVRVQKIPRDGLHENTPLAPDEVQIDALADKDVAAEEDLMVEWPRRDGPSG
jgi:hypothetical protein